MEILSLVFVLVSLPLLWSGLLNLFYIPLSLIFELQRRRKRTLGDESTALVSIVVRHTTKGASSLPASSRSWRAPIQTRRSFWSMTVRRMIRWRICSVFAIART
jgi:hypothetical protein